MLTSNIPFSKLRNGAPLKEFLQKYGPKNYLNAYLKNAYSMLLKIVRIRLEKDLLYISFDTATDSV